MDRDGGNRTPDQAFSKTGSDTTHLSRIQTLPNLTGKDRLIINMHFRRRNTSYLWYKLSNQQVSNDMYNFVWGDVLLGR